MRNPLIIKHLLPFLLLSMASQAHAQLYDDTREVYGEMAPIFSHGIGYAGMVENNGEMIPWFVFSDFYVFNKMHFKSVKEERKYYKIAYNIKKVYPIALDIQKTISVVVDHLDSLPDKKTKEAYLKQVEKDLQKRYKRQLKKLTFTQGKLLIKLIDRQCSATSYQLIQRYMGKFKAAMWNAFASLFGASLKKEYDPEVDDRITERCILLIESGQM